MVKLLFVLLLKRDLLRDLPVSLTQRTQVYLFIYFWSIFQGSQYVSVAKQMSVWTHQDSLVPFISVKQWLKRADDWEEPNMSYLWSSGVWESNPWYCGRLSGFGGRGSHLLCISHTVRKRCWLLHKPVHVTRSLLQTDALRKKKSGRRNLSHNRW